MKLVARGIAIACLLGCVAMMAFSLVSLAAPGTELIPNRPSVGDVLTFGTIFLSFPTVGLIVIWKRPENPVGWLFVVIGVAITLSVFSSEYAGWAAYAGADLPAAQIVAWLGTWSWSNASSVAVPLALMLFPDGRFPGRRWRAAAWIGVAAAFTTTVAIAIRPGFLPGYDDLIPNPAAVGGPVGGLATSLAGFETLPMMYMTALALAALTTRAGRTDAERQQLKWLLYPASIFVVSLAAAGFTELQAAWSVALVALAAIPVAAGIAILRYRLYDIDVVIRRTLVYGAVIVVLGAVYVALVLAAQAALSALTGSDALPVALSTLAIAALFGPVRGRVRAAVDRRFYRARYDAQRTLGSFAADLRDEVELDEVGRTLRDVAVRTVRPAFATVWLRDSK
jgi:hypothetical protein